MGIEHPIKRRRYNVTDKNDEKVTSVRNSKYRKKQRERPELKERYITDLKNKRAANFQREDIMDIDILAIWPKMVEYAGLSEYEAKVYLSLLGLGSSGARKLSLHCHVPRTKVYGTLKKLIDYGLVVEIPGVPKAFAPSAPDDAFSAILNIVKNKALDFTDIVESLTETHEMVKTESSPQKKVVWYIDEDSDIMGKCHEIMSQSVNSVSVLTTADGLSLLFNSAPRLLDQLQEQGVEVRLYSPLDPKKNPLARELSYLFEVKKVTISTPILFIDSDHRRFVLAQLFTETGERAHIKSAIFSDDPTILSLLYLLMVDEKKIPLLKTLSI